MVAYTNPQRRKKEECKRLRGEIGQINSIGLRIERRQVVYKAPKKEERRKRRLRGEENQIKFINLRFEIGQVVRFRKARRKQ